MQRSLFVQIALYLTFYTISFVDYIKKQCLNLSVTYKKNYSVNKSIDKNLCKRYNVIVYCETKKEVFCVADKFKGRIVFNSPVTLGFAGICLTALLLNIITNGTSNDLLFSVYRSSLANPLTYLRFFGHVFGHADFSHFMNNMMYILLLGPMLEEKYGKKDMILIILSTALVTGLIDFIIFPHTAFLGASGVVFAFILLSSFAGFKDGKIPVTFIIVACLYIGQEVWRGITIKDNVSNFSHIVGGLTGSAFGFAESRNRR